MSYTAGEVKSGLLITVAFVLLLGLTFIVGIYASGPTETYRIEFNYINGLTKSSPVYYAGFEVGMVKEVNIVRGADRGVTITVEVPKGTELPIDSMAHIDTLGMMGEKFLELTPGENPELYRPGDLIVGTDPIPMYEFIEIARLLADRMDELTVSLVPLVQDLSSMTSKHQEEIALIIANVNETTANLRDMTSDLKFRPWRLLRKG